MIRRKWHVDGVMYFPGERDPHQLRRAGVQARGLGIEAEGAFLLQRFHQIGNGLFPLDKLIVMLDIGHGLQSGAEQLSLLLGGSRIVRRPGRPLSPPRVELLPE